MNVAWYLMQEVKIKRPDVYDTIAKRIQPHSLQAFYPHLNQHLKHFDLNLFNQYRENIPDFCEAFFRHVRLPTPGDALGIHLTCRITKVDTQGTLDSKHLQSSGECETLNFCVEKAILNQLAIFSSPQQVFEIANKRTYASVFVRNTTIEDLMSKIPNAGHLKRGLERNKGLDGNGNTEYLRSFRFIVVEDRGSIKVLYKSAKDIFTLLKYLTLQEVIAFSDIRYLYNKCGILSHFFNMVTLVQHQLFKGDDSTYEKDVLTLIKYQCRSGKPLPLTRDGLAQNPDRSPLEVLSFEAPKKNYARLSTFSNRDQWCPVKTSSDKIFFGQQFNEGTGYCFEVRNKEIQ